MPKGLLLHVEMRNAWLLFAFSLLIACGEPVVEKPANLVPKETMVNLLYDLSLTHAAKGINPKLVKDLNMNSMEFLFEKYGIDSVRYVQSDLYYASLPEEYEDIYAQVVQRLESTKDRVEAERKRVNDSVKEAVRRRKSPLKADSIRRTSGDELP